MELNEVRLKYTSAEAGLQLHRQQLAMGARKVGGASGSGAKIAKTNKSLGDKEAEQAGGNGENAANLLGTQSLNQQIQDKKLEQQKKLKRSVDSQNKNVSSVSSNRTSTDSSVAVASQHNPNNSSPSSVHQNKSIVSVVHNPNKPKKLKTFKQMFPNNT